MSIEYEGRIIEGTRTIKGTRKLFQTVSFGGSSKPDGHPYKPNEEVYMQHIARVLLRELVEESESR